MRLWNEYEGTTIAGAYPIERLIRPEGRSAFFSTSNGTGIPAVLRLIEAINDEAEILNRWQAVASLKEQHLVQLKSFGQTVFEGTPLIYVLMENTEADLAGILAERPLTVDETTQLATSLIPAVQALHRSGMIHEHIEPATVLAAGEVIKLRSDCVREAPEGEEGAALRKRDVHDLALVLLRALTLRRSLEEYGSARLPGPFDDIIRNGIYGNWGLEQMAAALTPPAAPKPAPAPAAEPVKASVTPPVEGKVPEPGAKAEQIPLAIPGMAANQPSAKREETVPGSIPVRPASTASGPAKSVANGPSKVSRLETVALGSDVDPTIRRRWKIAVMPAALVIVAALLWHFTHRPAPQPVTTLADMPRAQQPAPRQPAAQPIAQPAPTPAAVAAQSDPAAQAGPADPAHRWRVVAYTYNHRDQAQHKVDEVAQRAAAMEPSVFTPTGRAPYLVALGGFMTRSEAQAFRVKALHSGMPRDVYIQNYRAR